MTVVNLVTERKSTSVQWSLSGKILVYTRTVPLEGFYWLSWTNRGLEKLTYVLVLVVDTKTSIGGYSCYWLTHSSSTFGRVRGDLVHGFFFPHIGRKKINRSAIVYLVITGKNFKTSITYQSEVSSLFFVPPSS